MAGNNKTSPSDKFDETLAERLKQAETSSPSYSAADYVVHRRIVLTPRHVPTGKTRHTVGTWSEDEGLVPGVELPTPHELMIAQILPDQGYYLFYLDEGGNEISDTYHDSLERALAQANWEFGVGEDEWLNLRTEDETEPHG